MWCSLFGKGVLSPVVFAVYVDDLIVKLSESGEGSCINGMYVGCVMYADDLVLLSASYQLSI